jgi:hypothetical protein
MAQNDPVEFRLLDPLARPLDDLFRLEGHARSAAHRYVAFAGAARPGHRAARTNSMAPRP